MGAHFTIIYRQCMTCITMILHTFRTTMKHVHMYGEMGEVPWFFAKKGSKSLHSIILDQREWLSVLSCVNTIGKNIPHFYIYKGRRMRKIIFRSMKQIQLWQCRQKPRWSDFYFQHGYHILWRHYKIKVEYHQPIDINLYLTNITLTSLWRWYTKPKRSDLMLSRYHPTHLTA